MISVQTEDFDHGYEYQTLRDNVKSDGAIVTFTGLVRDFNVDGSVSSIYIEHYAGMTEKSLMAICAAAKKRWQLGHVRLIHRIGHIKSHEQIVFVGITSVHRQNAFDACQFIMDYLKTQAPLWKQEGTAQGMQWVASKMSDEESALRWLPNNVE